MNIKLIIKNTISVFSRLRHKLDGNRFPYSAEIGSGTHMHRCRLGKYVYIGSKCTLNGAEIGNYTCIAPGVQIGGMEHSYWWYSTNPQLSTQCIENQITRIGHDVWVAAGAIIKQGVTIGDGAVVGAGSFVNKDVPPYTIVVGSPAKILKNRFDEDTIAILNETRYWHYSPTEARNILCSLVNNCNTNNNNNDDNE